MSLTNEVQGIEESISLLQEKVQKHELMHKYYELQSKWEISTTRIIVSAATTYFFVATFLFFANVEDFLVSALLPAMAYMVSTQSIPIVKKMWVKHFLKSESEKEHEKEEASEKVFKAPENSK